VVVVVVVVVVVADGALLQVQVEEAALTMDSDVVAGQVYRVIQQPHTALLRSLQLLLALLHQ
jgi:hypothetical protein